MFEIKDLCVDVGDFFLKDINITLQNGEYLVILGKSGTGKTVLLETIAGRYNVTKGRIIKDGEEITSLSPEKRNIGFVYQNYELFSHLKVKENIGFALKFKKILKKDKDLKTYEMMEDLSVTHLKDRYPKDLSGGEKQRVAIARSIIKSPNLLLLDEPFSALDYITKENVKEVLKNVHKKFNPIVIHVTHDIEEAIYFADKIGILKDNTIVKIFSKEELDSLESEDVIYEYI